MRTVNLIGRLLTLLFLCGTAAAGQAASDIRTPENRVIYEVFVRNFSDEGNLKGVERQIPRLKELGVDVIWLMPIYTPGVEGRWGTYSSPYAVRDYKGIDPDYGTADDLRSLVSAIHQNGMEIWLDWVANHTSKDNVWVYSHPEYYGNNFYSPNGWNDVYQLDFSCKAMHDAMIDAMQYWVSEFDIDGFRCDYASGPSDEFWNKATSRVLKNGKRVAWLAEDDSKPELVANGWFDYNYAWYFHDRLLDFARGANVNTLANECANLHNEQAYYGRSRIVYLTNHDVVQDKGGTEDRNFHKYLYPLTVLEFTVYGMPLIYNGQEIQYSSGAVSLAEKTPIDWSNPETRMTELIKTLCRLKHTQRALDTGATGSTLVNHKASDSNVYVYERRNGDESLVVMLNFGDNATTFTVTGQLPGYTATDVFSGKTATMVSGTTITLPASGYAVFVRDDNADPTPQTTRSIYIKNDAGWTTPGLYGWSEELPELFGAWPGLTSCQTETVNGIEYLKFTVTGHDNETYNLILNNSSADNLQIDLATITLDRESYFFGTDGKTVVTVDPENPVFDYGEADRSYNIYILDESGWNSLYLYAYHDGKDSLFGSWPGRQVTDTEMKGDVLYKVIRGVEASDKPHCLIPHNNEGTQYDIEGTYPIDRDIYLMVTPEGAVATSSPAIAADITCEEAYFTLQGIRVAEPENGKPYIVKKGAEAGRLVMTSH